MAGFKKRLNESLQLKLSFSLSLAILLVAAAAGIFSFASAYADAHDLQDDMLRQVAALFDRQRLPPAHLDGDGRAEDHDDDSRLVVQYLGERGRAERRGDAGAALALPATLADGLHTLEVDDEAYRVLVKTTSRGEKIAVAQETSVRDDIASDSAWRTLIPFLILAASLPLVAANLVRKMFRPVAALSVEIDRRSEQALHPVEAGHLPVEVRPFAVAINRLLARVSLSMETQRRFVADAAHELRSPLTALSLQAERLAEAPMAELARERLVALRRGIERGRRLLDQLLSLARAQAAPPRPKSAVSVRQVYRRVLEDLLPLAEDKRIDIGVEGERDVHVLVDELDLTALVKNLVDNAIRYTPDGGRVDLSVTTENGRARLRIRDSGPGIAVAERERVFDPFYRTLGSEQAGSGLGLSIVKAIAERMGAETELAFADEAQRRGLSVSVLVPLADVGARA